MSGELSRPVNSNVRQDRGILRQEYGERAKTVRKESITCIVHLRGKMVYEDAVFLYKNSEQMQ